MTNSSSNFFRGLSESVGSEGCRGLVRRILMYKDPARLLNFDELLRGEDTVEEASSSTRTFHDYRLLDLTVMNVRAFPYNAPMPYGIDLSNEAKEACSAFIVGNNGFGKSSIYCALEYLYTGTCSYAQRVDIPVERYLTNLFMEEMPEPHNHLNIMGKNPDQFFIQALEKNPVGTPAAFTSDYDIEELERSDDNLYQYVLKALGYGDVLAVQNLLRQALSEKLEYSKWLANYIDSDDAEISATDYQAIRSELFRIVTIDDDDRERLLRFEDPRQVDGIIRVLKLPQDDNTPDLSNELFAGYWEELQANLSLTAQGMRDDAAEGIRLGGRQADVTVTNKEAGYQIRRIKTLYKKLKGYCDEVMSVDPNDSSDRMLRMVEIIERLDQEYQNKDIMRDVSNPDDELNAVRQELDIMNELDAAITNGLSQVAQNYCNSFGPFIEDALSSFSVQGEVSETFRMMRGDGLLKLVLDLKDSKGDTPKVEVSPRAYFNTFRFKLYALSFRLTLALTYMQENNIRIPIVIDDVFSASDFENGLKIEQFVYNIYKVYKTRLQFAEPLQLILLTHDEMILNSFRRGIKLKLASDALIKNNKSPMPEDYFVCGRLYPYWKYQELKAYSKPSLGFYNLFFHYATKQ